jgi:hypothetical protein
MRRIVTGLFPTREAAERGIAALRALGVAEDKATLHEEAAQDVPPATEHAPGGEPGLPSLLDALFLPARDLAAHREALRQGQFVVSAEVAEDRLEAAIEALDAAGAVDLDEAEQGWREGGWTPATAAGATGGDETMPGTGGMDAEAARQLGQAGAGGTSRDPVEAARRDPPIGRARSYAIDAPLAEEGDAKP